MDKMKAMIWSRTSPEMKMPTARKKAPRRMEPAYALIMAPASGLPREHSMTGIMLVAANATR